ncbi:MAG: hypothetical protein ACTSVM_02005 [Candidatus Ranarchaeia archaeon]
MGELNWVQIVAALVGGGAAGAVINMVVSSYRGRRQPVGSRIDILPVFRQTPSDPRLQAKIVITHDNQTATFENLFLAEIQVVNRGNKDMDEFLLGTTLVDNDRCIYVEAVPPDRHHQVFQEITVSPQSPQKDIDIVLQPFNRGDSYLFKLYLVIPEGQNEPGEIKLGSSSPIKFVEMPTAGELIARVASEAIKIGPFHIGWRS